jgi:hypothetical protein
MNSRELLLRARQLLIERGWCQGALFETEQGPYCAMGAIRYAAKEAGIPEFRNVGSRTNATIIETKGTPIASAVATLRDEVEADGIAGWNDENFRTKDEVLDAFCKAAGSLKEGE